jgi:hypothetical protein
LNGEITTNIFYDEEKQIFRMEVINLSGFGHEELLELDPDEVALKVFAQKNTSLHTKSREERSCITVSDSSGDGAWIMQKCASTLKGKCDIRFEKERTVFSFSCPSKSYDVEQECTFTHLPENTWGIVIDDSGIQRKLMDRFLKIAGVSKERRIIVGADAKEIYGFCDFIVGLLKSNPDDRFLVIANENLEVVEGPAVHGLVSGSLCLQEILERLEPSDERRVLCLVRSANDSAKEVGVYLARAHGFLLKAPIDKNGVLEAIKPWWIKRFPPQKKSQILRLSAFTRSNSFGSNTQSSHDDDSDCYDPFHDIQAILELIDALCSSKDPTSLQKRWHSIRDLLQTLKGDLKTVIPTAKGGEVDALEAVTNAIDELRRGDFQQNLKDRWALQRLDIVTLMNLHR